MKNYKTFAAIIYVTQTEKQAVDRMYDWKELTVEGDGQEYREAYIERDGRRLRIVSAQQDEMGMTASATLTTKMINEFVPQYVVMPGIAAGTGSAKTTSEQEYGDVLLADSVWNCSNGKYVAPSLAEVVFGDIGFKPRPTIVELEGEYMNAILDFAKSDRNEFYVHCGPLASGTAVVANKAVVHKQIMRSFNGTEGVEMEGYGVAYAASHAVEPKPHTIIAKSICDFADEHKDDSYQKFAAYTSCGFIKELLDRVLVYSGE